MLGIDIGAGAAIALRFGHHVHGEGGLARGLRAVDLSDTAAGKAADAQRHVKRQCAGGDRLDVQGGLLPHPHDRAFAKLLIDLAESHVECLAAIRIICHGDLLGDWGTPAVPVLCGLCLVSTLRTGCDNEAKP